MTRHPALYDLRFAARVAAETVRDIATAPFRRLAERVDTALAGAINEGEDSE